MDLDLMINSFPKLLSATLITLKLLSASLFFGLLVGLLFAILRMNKNIFMNDLILESNFAICFFTCLQYCLISIMNH